MGLMPSLLALLVDLHRELDFEGPVLTLGNQDVYATYDDLRTMFAERGVPARETDSIRPHTSKMFEEAWPERTRDYVHAATFFSMLGLRGYTDLDLYSPDAEPGIVHDLNRPVPADLEASFGLVLDSGTMEHVFDVRTCMRNIVEMVRLGGWVIHISPANGQIDQGFYQFSPSFFFDYYTANGFDRPAAWLLEWNVRDSWEPFAAIDYTYGMYMNGLLDPDRAVLTCFLARRARDVPEQIPTQGFYDPERTLPVAAGDWSREHHEPLRRRQL